MGGGRKRHTRRKRRQFKQAMKNGKAAKPTHKLKTGRTGAVHTRKLRSRRSE